MIYYVVYDNVTNDVLFAGSSPHEVDVPPSTDSRTTLLTEKQYLCIGMKWKIEDGKVVRVQEGY